MKQKGQAQILILAGIVLILALVGGAYYFGTQKSQIQTPQPTPSPLSTEASVKVDDETTNWKTYTSKEIGFQFSYPAYASPINGDWGKNGEVINFLTKDLSLNIKVYSLKFKFLPPENSYQDTGEKIRIGNNTWRILLTKCGPAEQGCPKPGTAVYDYQTVMSNYQVNYIFNYGKPEDSLLRQFLSTFKFTN